MSSPSTIRFIIFLVALSISGPLSINFYLALLPNMAQALSASAATIQQTVSIYLIGFAGAQLIVGPLSDRFGRKPILLFCYALFLVASLACALAPTVEFLIAGRFVQALGGCAGVLISRAIVRDVYPPKEMGKVMAYMMTGFSIAPLIAPTIGGFIGVAFGWRSLFFVFCGIGLLLILWIYFGFQETNKSPNPEATQLKKMASNYASLLINKTFLSYFVMGASAVGGILTYTSGSSFVLIEVLKVPAQYYGLLFSITAFGLLLGSLISARLNSKYGSKTTAWYGGCLLLTGGSLAALFPLLGIQTIPTLIGPMFIYTLGNGVAMPAAMSNAISPFPKKAGSAAAIIGCAQSALGALCGYIVSELYDHSALPMTSMIGLMSLLAFSGVLYVRIQDAKNANKHHQEVV